MLEGDQIQPISAVFYLMSWNLKKEKHNVGTAEESYFTFRSALREACVDESTATIAAIPCAQDAYSASGSACALQLRWGLRSTNAGVSAAAAARLKKAQTVSCGA